MSIIRHTFYNVIGTAIPTVLALVTVPAYLHLIGAERYGVLAIAWLILGYFGVFDLGLGSATTQRIAILHAASPQERASAFGTALVSNLVVGVVGAALFWPASWYLFSHEMRLEPALRAETLAALPLLALAVPVATTLGVLSGALVGRQKFLLTNRVSVTNTTLFQLLPLAVAWWYGPQLWALLAASIAARVVGLALYWRECAREFGADALRRFDPAQFRALIAFGGWVTVTAAFGPFLAMADRFMIGALISAAAVTLYVVPYLLTGRVSMLNGALTNAMFPRLAAARGEEAGQLARYGVGVQLALLTPPIAAAFVLMQPGLDLWVGVKVGDAAAPVGRILLVAAWLNTFATVAYARLQAEGRPDLVSKVLLCEIMPFLAVLYFAITHDGVVGAAWVYLVRIGIDLALLNWVSSRRFDHFAGIVAALVGFGALELALPHLPAAPLWRLLAALAVALVYCGLSALVMPRQLLAKARRPLGRIIGLSARNGGGQ